ncbi:hypothetical protein [uncultured Paracoccus sp.]|uniref:hypothetical protein n=1 Tax=uncultured Paracoccus sp. TaxID=189685 RepID=UPI0025F406C0|nr:hypothetical protein [uncultured Paracoccus sp.]
MSALSISALHEAVIGALVVAFPEVALVTGQNDALDDQQLPLPAIVVQITEVEARADQDSDGTGRLPVTVYFAATLVLSDRQRDLAIDLREAAMAIAALVYGNRWGLGGHVGPAQFTQAGPDEFSPQFKGRSAWRVEWMQPAWIGATAWPEVPGPTPVPLASWVPDIGPGNEGHYEGLPDL